MENIIMSVNYSPPNKRTAMKENAHFTLHSCIYVCLRSFDETLAMMTEFDDSNEGSDSNDNKMITSAAKAMRSIMSMLRLLL